MNEQEMREVVVAQIAENFRFYGDMRFKQLTVFIAAMTAVAVGILQFSEVRWWIALGGLYVSGVMWVVEVRATLNAIGAHNAIPEIFPQSEKRWPLLNSSFAVLSLHIVSYAVCCWLLRFWYRASITFYIGAAVGFLLLYFSSRNYWKVRSFWLGSKSKKS